MNYTKNKLKEGINIHVINTEKFKTDLISIFLTVPLKRDTVTKTALLPLVLKRGTNNIKTQEEISEKLENLYGASFDCGVEKSGNNQVIKFYLEAVDKKFIPEDINMLEKSLDILTDIVFNPLTQNNAFKQEYLDGEKNKLKQIIESRKDNKAVYASSRCIEEMYKGKPYGLYRYGYVEDLEEITPENLYQFYKTLLSECKIDIFASGDIEEKDIQTIKQNNILSKINERIPNYTINGEDEEKNKQEEKQVEEKMDVMQGKLVIGLDVDACSEEEKYAASIYNIILGGSANSKLFQNVREKAGLAYTAASSYLRQKNNVIIRCGIENENYQKAVDIIKEQLKDIEIGKFEEEDIANAKNIVIATLEGITDSQDAELSYYFGQELSKEFTDIEEYMKNIKKVQKKDVENIAKKININTIYFLHA